MLIAALRQLWRHRRLVLVGAWISLSVFLLVTVRITAGIPPDLESRSYYVGAASVAVLIDSQSSQAVDLGAGGEVKVDTGALSARAKLLANLLVTRPLRDEIARRSGIGADRLIARLSSTTEPGAPPPVASDVQVSPDDPEANILDLQTSDTVPIITVNAQAPTEETASALAASTVTILRRYLQTVADENAVPDVRQLVMRPLGRPTSAALLRGPNLGRSVFTAVLLFALWCGGILAVTGLLSAWRQAAADDEGVVLEALLTSDGDDVAADGPLEPAVPEGADDESRASPAGEPASRVA